VSAARDFINAASRQHRATRQRLALTIAAFALAVIHTMNVND
jgi:hypothetical protein